MMMLAWKIVGLFWGAAFIICFASYIVGHATFTNPYPWLPAALIILTAATLVVAGTHGWKWLKSVRTSRGS
ncbi:hypothetical protein ACEXQD_06710 [Herbiconiux sp. P15]|uniref:hypothetical protein n=1 Tax=Herbiconiux liukaitaii TaxID=3342799 RepID=UPI0035B8759F